MTKAQIRRVVASGAVLLYGCLVAAAVFLPLPGPTTPRPTQTIQLVPVQWIDDVHRELRTQGLSWVHAYATPAFQGATLNVLLFVPLGILARVLFKRGFVGTALLGFACSLLVEATQLTANWGTAPFQYRIFDVDDLLNNTGGATLGWLAGALFLSLHVTGPGGSGSAEDRPARPAAPAWPPAAPPAVVRLADPPTRPLPRPR